MQPWLWEETGAGDTGITGKNRRKEAAQARTLMGKSQELIY